MVCGGGCLSSHSIPYRPEYLVLYRPVGLSSLWRPDGKIHISHYRPFRLAVFALAAHKKGVFPTAQGRNTPTKRAQKGGYRRLPVRGCVLVKRSMLRLLVLFYGYGCASASFRLPLRLRLQLRLRLSARLELPVASLQYPASVAHLPCCS